MTPSRRALWTINGRFICQSLTGVQRYAVEIVKAMDQLLSERNDFDKVFQVELLAPASARSLPELNAIRTRTAGPLNGHLWEQTTLPLRGGDYILSLCNTGPVLASNHLVCIHDANTRLVPNSYSPAFRRLYRILLPLLGRTSKAVATVSQFSADRLIAFGIAPRGKLFLAPDGHEHVLQWSTASRSEDNTDDPDTILLLGSRVPHKNIGVILGLADKLAAHKLRIAVIGAADQKVFTQAEARPGASNIEWLGALEDDQIYKVFNRSLCLAFPSLAEGFGLPALEAMALGRPVVASDRTSLPEVCGDAALYAPPDQPDAWLARFIQLKTDANLRREMGQRGRARAQLFSWRDSASILLNEMVRATGGDRTTSIRRELPPAWRGRLDKTTTPHASPPHRLTAFKNRGRLSKSFHQG